MFLNIVSKQLKIGVRDKAAIFWTLMFPVILGTLFYMAFGKIFESYVVEPIKTAVYFETDNEEVKEHVIEVLDNIRVNDKEVLAATYDEDLENAQKLLEDDKIGGIIKVAENGKFTVVVRSNGNQATMLDIITSTYNEQLDLIQKVSEEHPEKLNEVYEGISKRVEYLNNKDLAGENKDPFVQYFYNIIAMAALFSSFNSVRIGNNSQANMSAVGARTNASPVNRLAFQFGSLIASFIVQTVVNCVALSYIIFVLKIKFGGNIFIIYATTVLATLCGLALGFLVGNIGSANRDKKESFLSAVSLISCALSGLMYGDMKIVLLEKAPIVNKINPAAVISDAFYSLNMFGAGSRFFKCIISLIIMSAVMIIGAIIFGRRNSYDSL